MRSLSLGLVAESLISSRLAVHPDHALFEYQSTLYRHKIAMITLQLHTRSKAKSNVGRPSKALVHRHSMTKSHRDQEPEGRGIVIVNGHGRRQHSSLPRHPNAAVVEYPRSRRTQWHTASHDDEHWDDHGIVIIEDARPRRRSTSQAPPSYHIPNHRHDGKAYVEVSGQRSRRTNTLYRTYLPKPGDEKRRPREHNDRNDGYARAEVYVAPRHSSAGDHHRSEHYHHSPNTPVWHGTEEHTDDRGRDQWRPQRGDGGRHHHGYEGSSKGIWQKVRFSDDIVVIN